MTTISRTATVAYTPAQMFALVNDIKAYPEFLQWCTQTEVLSASPDEVRASLTIAALGVSKQFSILNRLQADKMIEIRLIDGPFKHLEGFWRFDEIENGCKISFDLEFEMSGGILSYAIGPVFTQMTSTLVEAFTKRAQDVYNMASLNEEVA